jgi:DNA repair protein SbcC/Rad50
VITRLHLENFRRHTDTELVFSDTDQLVVISGNNGVGKSSLIEGITFALHGEGRNGRRNLDALVRRGAELEGLTVTLEFRIADSEFRVERRRAEGVGSAVLYANGEPICSGPDAVTAEISRILGMDAAGFRLAVLARQKELDGLTSMNRRERKLMLARLLRVDALSKSIARAHDRYTQAAEVLKAMGAAPDLEALGVERDRLAAEAAAAAFCVEELRARLAALDNELAETAEVETSYRAATEAAAHARGALAAAEAALARAEAAKEGHTVPAGGEPHRPMASVLDDLREVSNRIAAAEALAQAHSDASMVRAELDEVCAALDALGGPGPMECEAAVIAAEATVEDLLAKGEACRDERRRVDTEMATIDAEALTLHADQSRLDELGATCPTCRQGIDGAHRDAQRAELDSRAGALTARRQALEVEGAELEERLLTLRAEHRSATDMLSDARLAHQKAVADADTRATLERRRDTYVRRLARPLAELPDLATLVAERDQLLLEETAVRSAEALDVAHGAALAEEARLAAAWRDARDRHGEAAKAAATAEVASDLLAAFEHRAAVIATRAATAETTAETAATAAESRAMADAAATRVADAEQFATAHARRAAEARVAAHTKALLQDVHDRVSAQLRPSLEAAVSDLVARLSEGRFASVKVSDDYDITVLDDGAYRPLAELSGGEGDLVALACRLALASVVAERHGTDAAGLLILDECFGSQDPARRESILSTLRQLRGVYGQILLISHVGGLDEAADKVIDITTNPERTETEVTIT